MLDRVALGESLIITPCGKAIARLMPVAGERAKQAAARILERPKPLKRVPLADLIAARQEGYYF